MIYVYNELEYNSLDINTENSGRECIVSSSDIHIPVNTKIFEDYPEFSPEIQEGLNKSAKVKDVVKVLDQKTMMSFNHKQGYFYLGYAGEDVKVNTDIILVTLNLETQKFLNIRLYGGAKIYAYDKNIDGLMNLVIGVQKVGDKSSVGIVMNIQDPEKGYLQKCIREDRKRGYIFNERVFGEDIPVGKNGKPILDKQEEGRNPKKPNTIRFKAYRPNKPAQNIICNKNDYDELIKVLTENFRVNPSDNKYIIHKVEGSRGWKQKIRELHSSRISYVTAFMPDLSASDVRSRDFTQTLKTVYGIEKFRHVSILYSEKKLHHIV